MGIVVLGSERITWETELAFAVRGRSPFSVEDCLVALDRIGRRNADEDREGLDAIFGPASEAL